MSKFNDFQTILNAAESYLTLGYAVIPLLGDIDPSRPKVAACAWGIYQRQQPALSDVQTWFSPSGIGAALGIVTGTISRLIVLDFDSSDAFADFSRRYPDLLDTRTVHSAGRGLPHLYFRLPSGLHIASQKLAGVDLLSDGRYVVAPPSIINGQPYKIVRGGMPRTLTDHDIHRLNTFLTTYKEATPRPATSSDLVSLPPLLATAGSPLERAEGWSGVSPASPVGTQRAASANAPTSSVEAHGRAPLLDLPYSPRPEGEGPGVRVSPMLNLPLPSHSPTPSRRGGAETLPSFPSLPSLKSSVSQSPSLYTERGLGGEVSSKIAKPTRADLHALYTYWLTKGGRNDALFRTAIHARDNGWNEAQTRRTLIPLHTTSVGAHRRAPLPATLEPLPLRQREATATIRSAFSRPARIPRVSRSSNATANSVREWLMQHHVTFVVRTLEGLMQTGFKPGQVFTADQAITALKGIVGRDSVYNALNALTPNGKPFFRRKFPSALPKASNEAAKVKSGLKTKKCFFVTQQKSGITKKGPKQRLYTLPTNRDLCRLLRVKTTGSDTLTRDDLSSARQTRMALHRELIKRRPAEYTRAWLAGRLGVSRRTVDAYNQLIPIYRAPTYITTALSWANLNHLPEDEPQAGAFIETLYGKKYPALRPIAARLMGQGKFIRLQQRTGSYYWYGTAEPPAQASPVGAHGGVPLPSPSLPRPEGNGQSEVLPSLSRRGGSVTLPPTPTSPVGAHGRAALQTVPSHSPTLYTERGRGGEVSRYRKPLTNAAHETLAQHIYTRVNGRSTESTRQLSLSNARRLVATYGEIQVSQTLRLFEGRSQLNNPTGFFVSVLRSNSRLQALEIKKDKA